MSSLEIETMFITLEGIEGSGKTTKIDYLVEYLEKQGQRCVTTREPGGTLIGNKIRSILLDPESKDLDPTTELLLYMADRAQHINSLIKPSLAAGKTVICDRYFDATVVYQGFARGLDIDAIKRLHALLFDNLKPDLTFLLDLAPRDSAPMAKAVSKRKPWPSMKKCAPATLNSLAWSRTGSASSMQPGMSARCAAVFMMYWLYFFAAFPKIVPE